MFKSRISGILLMIAILTLVFIVLFPEVFKSILIGSLCLVAALFGFNKGQIRKQSDEIKKEQRQSKKRVDDIQESRKDRKKKADELSKELRDKDRKFKDTFLSIVLIFFLVLFPAVANAEDGEPPPLPEEYTEADLNIPDNYNDLLDKYYQMFEYAMFYRDMAFEFEKLYNEELADSDSLVKEIDRLNKMLETQQKMIDKLLKSDGGLGVNAGVNYVPLNPINSGLILGVSYEF